MRFYAFSTRYPAWILWLVGIPLAVVTVLLAVFFLTFFLVFAGLIAITVGLRLWWMRRGVTRAATSAVIDGEYDVVGTNEPTSKRPRLPK